MHIPSLWNLSISITYSHYAMELPWSGRSNEAYATLFYPNYTEQQCTEVRGGYGRASLSKVLWGGLFCRDAAFLELLWANKSMEYEEGHPVFLH